MTKSTFRNARKNKFTQISNDMLNDPNLSLEAKGLLSIFLSNSEDWKINMANIIKRSKNGRDKHYNVVKELVANGYFGRVEVRENGRFKELVYIFSDDKRDVEEELKMYEGNGTNIDVEPSTPSTETQETEVSDPVTENTEAVESLAGGQYINNTNRQNTRDNNTNLNNKNLNLDQTNKYIWEMKVPMALKKYFSVKVKDLVSDDTFDLTSIEYFYNSHPEYIKPSAEFTDEDYLNDFEFTRVIKKMHEDVNRPISNMDGLIKSWVQWGLHYKKQNIDERIFDDEQ